MSDKTKQEAKSERGGATKTAVRPKPDSLTRQEGEFRPMSQTELANRAFLEQASQIPNIKITVRGGEMLADQSFTVEVPEIRSDETRQISALTGRLYRQYRNARLEVSVLGRKELESVYADSPDADDAEE